MKNRFAPSVFLLALFLAIPAHAKWIWDPSGGTLTADGTGLTPAGTVLKGGVTAGNWGRDIVANQVQISGNSGVTYAVLDLTEPIETADGTTKTLESIAASCFLNNKNLVKVLLPDTVKFIGQQAFNNCSALQDIGRIPNQIREFGGGAFNGCTSLTNEIVLPQTLRGTTWNTFYNTQMTGDIVWPATAGDVQIMDFYGTKITSFTIPEGANCKKIRREAFRNCALLTNVVLHEGLTTLGEGGVNQGDMFRNSGLQTIHFPSTLTDIGYNTFYDCKSLTGEFVWPETVANLPANCFNGSGISSFVAKTGLKRVYQQVFQNCSNLQTVILSDTLETMDQASWAQSVVGLTVYWRACPANALPDGLYNDWGSGRNRTHYFSATPEIVAAWQAYAASDRVNEGHNWSTFVLPAVSETGVPKYHSVGTAGQEGGKIYWWKDPDLLPLPTLLELR